VSLATSHGKKYVFHQRTLKKISTSLCEYNFSFSYFAEFVNDYRILKSLRRLGSEFLVVKSLTILIAVKETSSGTCINRTHIRVMMLSQIVEHVSSITYHYNSRFLTVTKLYCLVTDAQWCEQLAQCWCLIYSVVSWPRVETVESTTAGYRARQSTVAQLRDLGDSETDDPKHGTNKIAF